jgi:hypothetical protein
MADPATEKPDDEKPDVETDVLVLEPAAVAAEPAPEPPAERRMGGVPAAVGGALAAIFGFGLAQVVPGGWPLQGTDAIEATVAEQAATIAEQQAELVRLGAALDAVAARPAADPDLSERLATLEAAIPAPFDDAALSDRVAAIETRLAAIEALPVDGSGASPAALAAQAAALAALQADVAALRDASGSSADVTAAAEAAEARLAEAEQRAEALRAAAEADAAQAEARSALRQIDVALEAGGPFASALPAFDPATLPAVLADNAATGLPTITDLQASFPDAARAALEASLRADMGESWSERVGSFLRSQTGARSLTPREGNDPDAVLSRAEAILAEGRPADALAELAALPPEGQAAMTEWTDLVQLHLAGRDAFDTLRAAAGGE